MLELPPSVRSPASLEVATGYFAMPLPPHLSRLKVKIQKQKPNNVWSLSSRSSQPGEGGHLDKLMAPWLIVKDLDLIRTSQSEDWTLLTRCVTTGKLLKLSTHQFLHLQTTGTISTYLGCFWWEFGVLARSAAHNPLLTITQGCDKMGSGTGRCLGSKRGALPHLKAFRDDFWWLLGKVWLQSTI